MKALLFPENHFDNPEQLSIGQSAHGLIAVKIPGTRFQFAKQNTQAIAANTMAHPTWSWFCVKMEESLTGKNIFRGGL